MSLICRFDILHYVLTPLRTTIEISIAISISILFTPPLCVFLATHFF
uniref:Uncharacterized protein n=1 Tax=Meloidogyne enterolobii TaxID=390850 RepID=A0A6V7UGX9_MELEN|nr:unnamed protein product [Meloidogyne enterolobii]